MEGREEARKQLVDVLLDVCQWRLVAATHLTLRSISGPSPDSGVACPCPVPQCSSGLPNLQSQSTVTARASTPIRQQLTGGVVRCPLGGS